MLFQSGGKRSRRRRDVAKVLGLCILSPPPPPHYQYRNRCDGSLHLLDGHSLIPTLKTRRGISKWEVRVMHRNRNGSKRGNDVIVIILRRILPSCAADLPDPLLLSRFRNDLCHCVYVLFLRCGPKIGKFSAPSPT